MDILSVTAAYLGVKQARLQQSVQTSLLRKAMDQEKQAAQSLLEIMPQKAPNPPHLGSNVDLYV